MKGFLDDFGVVNDLIIRLLNCTQNDGIYLMPEDKGIKFNSFVEKRIMGSCGDYDKNITKQLLVLIAETPQEAMRAERIRDVYKRNNTVVMLCKRGRVYEISVDGYLVDYDEHFSRKKDFKVLAIVHVYNEADVIKKTVEYLLDQDLDVYLVDNWSTDGSEEIEKKLHDEHPNRVFIERFPLEFGSDYYDWYHQLERTEELSKELDYDWFIHYDADEMRVSPWNGVTLREAIHYIDYLGYNLIENTVIDFRITDKDNESIFMQDGWFDFGIRPAHFRQTKTWKKTDSIELKSSGGHFAVVDNPKMFPLKVLNRHYPLRSIEQASRKVFQDRKPRFEKEQRERGWHSHYNKIVREEDFIFSKESLIKWTPKTIDEYWLQLFWGLGIVNIDSLETGFDILDYDIPEGSRLALYGAGEVGKFLYRKLHTKYNIEYWIDSEWMRKLPAYGTKIDRIDILDKDAIDAIIIAVKDGKAANEIRARLIDFGIERGKIKWNPVKC